MTKTRDLANLANGVTSANIVDGAITNVDVNNSAGITSSKFNFTQSGTGATTRTVESKLRDVVSVLDFIPPGTDTATTDCTTYIQAAFNSGAESIYIPAGTYRINTTLTIPATLKSVYGDQFKSILYSQTSSGQYLIQLTTCAVKLEGLVLYGAKIPAIGGSETVPSARSGINANVSGDRGSFRNLIIYGFDVGMYLGKSDASSYMHIFDQCDFTQCNTGLRFIDGLNQVTLLNCVFRNVVDYGLRIEPTQVGTECVSIGLYNCVFEFSTSTIGTLLAKNVRGLVISGCYFESNKSSGIYVYGDSTNGSQSVVIEGSYFYFGNNAAQQGQGITIGGNTRAVLVTANHFENYSVASYYPIKLGDYSGVFCQVNTNVYNNCTGNSTQILTDGGYQLVERSTLNNHSIVRNSGVTDGSGNLATLSLGKINLFNGAGRIFLKITVNRHSDDVVTVFTEESVYLRAIDAGSNTIGIGYRPNPAAGGVSFTVSSTTVFNGSLTADLQATVTSGDASTHYSFVVEVLNSVNAGLLGDKFIETTFS